MKFNRPAGWWAIVVSALVVLATIPYLPFFGLPHISDDYLQIELGRKYGPISGWGQLAGDALYRCRATSILLTNWTEQWFGATSAIFKAESTIFHIANTLLIAAFGSWRLIGWRLAIVSAGFFAVHEGHQEAVVWYAAIPELLVFFFALLSLHAWLRFLEEDRPRLMYGAALALFLLALLSKESAVAAVPILAGAGYLSGKNWRFLLKTLSPFAAISLGYTALIFASPETHLHLNDGTFAITSPVAEVVARSSFRLLWIWGLAALGFLAIRRTRSWQLVAGAGAWIVITLLPYSFLSYMPHVPSRHVYWASAGLAFLVGIAILSLWDSAPRMKPIAAGIAIVMIVHNCAYLWIRKYPQYERRAAPTEKLLIFSERLKGPITIKCFPYTAEVATLALQIRAGRSAASTLWNPNAAASDEGVYCDTDHP